MECLYGGGFNPPTLAHKQIIMYLASHYDKVIVLPTNNKYKGGTLAPFSDRLNMLSILLKDLSNVSISRFEEEDKEYLGTVHTLRCLNHPLFVIGADQLASIEGWIDSGNLVKENHFLVFPRSGIDVGLILESEFLKDYKDHFKVVDDFCEIDTSSTLFRKTKDFSLIDEEVAKYIKDNNLYIGGEKDV